MNIKLNGQHIEIDAGTTLATLLDGHGVTEETAGVAVAVNDVVVPRRNWETHVPGEGDRIEVVRAVQGG